MVAQIASRGPDADTLSRLYRAKARATFAGAKGDYRLLLTRG